MGNRIAIHTNPGLRHQVDAAAAVKAGFARHGLSAEVTADRLALADIHVCLGPWYALKPHIGHRVFYLDRAFWDDPGSVSLAWLDAEGNKVFRWGRGGKRPHPRLEAPKGGKTSAVVLCDYGMNGEQERDMARPLFDSVSIRRHPSQSPSGESLEDCFAAHQVAIGRHTSALVSAAIAGLAVVDREPHAPVAPIAGLCCRDLRHPDREGWINDLAFHNWTLGEIESGDAWHHLSQ